MRRRYIQRRGLSLVCAVWLAAWVALSSTESFSAKMKLTSFSAAERARHSQERAAELAELVLPSDDPAEGLRYAMQADDPMVAAARFAAVSRKFEIIADHASLMRTQKLMDARLYDEAASAVMAALERFDKSPLRTDFQEILGAARAALSDEEGARKAWTRGIRLTRDSERQAEMRLAVASSLERSDELEEALRVYRKIWTRHASSDQANLAEERLNALELEPGAEARSAVDWRKRADQLFRKRNNAGALAAYDKALAGTLKTSEANRAKKQRAHTLFRLREYPEAVKAFSSLPQNDDVPLWRARSLARSGEVNLAVEEFEKLAKQNKGELSVRATYLAALLLEGRGHVERAEEHFDWVSRNQVSTGLSHAALWRLGWAAFRGQKGHEAVDYFDRLLKLETDTIDRLRIRYWRARALESMDDSIDDQTAATLEFTTIANEFPFSYYGWRARDRIRDHDQPSAGARPEPGTTQLSEDDLARPRILLAAGLRKVAVEEMRRTGRRARGLADRLAMAQLFSEAEEYHEALRVIVDAYTEDLARGPVPHLEELWWHAWPSAFKELVMASTRDPGSVEPALVFAIMREESGYRPQILSTSGARGLLQIMVPTGDRLASRVGQADYDPDDLFEPETNIKLGAYYLTELLGRFDGRLSASIASYNAGPNAVEGWLGKPASTEDDVWVESIPYDQTRSYVKRVLRSYHAYRVLY
ncbi:MAG: transglycosylase SLT domain-containing protein [Myxococcales bacterium]|nr:transglycosylase SLT domain-containing protein [Myxococcales bacterium]